MPRVHEHENSSEEIFVEDVVLDVVGVVLDAEGKQLQNEAEQLHRAWIHAELSRLCFSATVAAAALLAPRLLVLARSGSFSALRRALDFRVGG